MIGVVSGMNEAGLTITLNAAPSDVPTSSATPISILAREILQYAGTVEEAFEIAKSRKTFVSESLLISSAADDAAVLIEKTPEETRLFRPDNMRLVCSNHFQSAELAELPRNREALVQTDSPYRYKLMNALLDTADQMTPQGAVELLRHRGGFANDELGLGNPLSINQLIAHHGVVFKPEERLVWVSSNPYQLGAFKAYDLNQIFSGLKPEAGTSMATDSLTIPESPFVHSKDFEKFQEYRKWLRTVKKAIATGNTEMSSAEVDRHLALNPNYYLGYQLAGELFLKVGKPDVAREYLNRALEMKIPYTADRIHMEEMLQQIEQHES